MERAKLYRRESSLINDQMLEFEHKKFKNAVADNLIFEHEDTDEDKQLTMKTLEQINRGRMPRGSNLFQRIMSELSDDKSSDIKLSINDVVPELKPVDTSSPRYSRKKHRNHLDFIRKLENSTFWHQSS